MEPRSVFWKTEFKIPGTPWIMSGYSRSAYRTGFFIHGLNIMLDAGPQSFKKPDHIFITHCHGDHIAELPFTMIYEIANVESKMTLYCPAEAEIELRKYIMQLHNTNSLKDTSSVTASYYNMVPINQEHTISRININKQLMEIETIGADHSVPTVIYGFSIVKDKLDSKYSLLSGKEIAQLKKAGEKVTIEVVDKKFSYVLDTSIKTVEENPQFLKYPVVIIECSLLMDDEYDLAEKKKHIHWLQLKPFIETNPDTLFVLTHFSMRYKDQEIKDFFDKIKANIGITNIHIWLTDPVI